MGEVVAFKPRAERSSSSSPALAPPTVQPAAHAPARPSAKPSLKSVWDYPANWLLSVKGNPYIRLDGERDEYCVTVWHTKSGWWRWCIARDSRSEPLWSPLEWDVEHEAREAAWQALEALER